MYPSNNNQIKALRRLLSLNAALAITISISPATAFNKSPDNGAQPNIESAKKLILEANALASQGQYKAAAANYARADQISESILKSAPNDAVANDCQARALNGLGNSEWNWSHYQQALIRYRQSIAAADQALFHDAKCSSAFGTKSCAQRNLGMVEEQLANYDIAKLANTDALASANECLVINPDNLYAKTAAGDALCARGHLDYLFARFDSAMKNFDQAIDIFDAARVQDPQNIANLMSKATALVGRTRLNEELENKKLASDDLKEAFNILDKIATTNPSNYDALTKLGSVKHEIAALQNRFFEKSLALQNLNSALKDFDCVLLAVPDDMYALRAKGRALSLQGLVQLNLRETMLAGKSLEEAMQAYHRALTIAPDDLSAKYGSSRVLGQQGHLAAYNKRYHEALKDFKLSRTIIYEQLMIAPNDIVILQELATTDKQIADQLSRKHQALNAWEAAASAYKKAVDISTEDVRIYERLLSALKSCAAHQSGADLLKRDRQIVKTYDAILALKQDGTDMLQEKISSLLKEGALLEQLGQTKEALAIYGDASDLASNIHATDKSSRYKTASIARLKGTSLLGLGLLRLKISQDIPLGIENINDGIGHIEEVLQVFNYDTLYLREGLALWARGRAQASLADEGAAFRGYREATKVFNRCMDKQSATVISQFGRGDLIVNRKTMQAKMSQRHGHSLNYEQAEKLIDHRCKRME